MTELIGQVADIDGIIWLVLAACLGGLVRGFSGFGAGLVFIPIASTVLSPVTVLVALALFDVFGALPLIPKAYRDGQKPEVGKLLRGMVFGLPLGLWVLTRIDPDLFRYAVSILSFLLFFLLVSGWRYRGTPSGALITSIGWSAGFMGGATGLAGPPVILFYLGGQSAVRTIRANIILFFLILDFMLLILLAWKDLLTARDVALGLILALPFAISGMLGQWLFNPDNERIFRAVAYAIIVSSAIYGLPLLDQFKP